VTVAADGSFAYDPGDGFVALAQDATATDRFAYTVADETGWAEQWTANITVVGVNDEPELTDAPSQTAVTENATATVALTATDPDDGDTLAFSLENAPAFVTLADGGDGTATVTASPRPGTAGTYEIGVTVTDNASPPATAQHTISVSVEPVAQVLRRVTDQLVVLYDFDEAAGSTVADSSGGSPVDLTIADPAAVTWGSTGLTINAPTLIASPAGATGLAEEIRQSNELTIEAWVSPAAASQPGPARVVSISADVTNRNATLAQGLDDGASGDVWTGRLRSTVSTDNGRPGISTPAGTATEQLTHVVYTRSSDGEVNIYVNGTLSATGTVGGDLSNWDGDNQLLLANETTGNRSWLGTYHLVAVFGKALSAAEVDQNFEVGI
jgi:hypothetical protein